MQIELLNETIKDAEELAAKLLILGHYTNLEKIGCILADLTDEYAFLKEQEPVNNVVLFERKPRSAVCVR